ncbi:MAG: TrpR-like protein YerC/YecD [Clostridia bacterium]|nr:TrpR-like protein YerC/YecD [Clostridia bacterium]
MANIQTPEFERLMEVVIKLETKEEALSFFEDICTIKEIQDMSQRFQVAEMLHQNKSYIEISKGTGASTATISRVNKCLNYGSDGYKKALIKLYESEAE